MVALRYAPGGAHLIATRATIVLIDADVETELLTRIWREVDEGRGLAAVLEALAGAFGTSLTAIPPFLVAVAEQDGVRLAVRGDIAVTAHSGSGPVRVSGEGVTTWSEQVVPDAARTEIVVHGASGDDARLPLRDGVVRASAVVVDWAAEGAASQGASAAPAHAAPEPSADAEADPAPERRDDDALDADTRLTADDAAPARETGLIEVPGIDTWVPQDATLIPELLDLDGTPTPPHGVAVAAADDDTPGPTGDAVPGPPVPATGIPPLPPPPPPVDAADVGDTVASVRVRGDHDGETISLAQARALRGDVDAAHERAPEPLAPPRPAAPGRLVLSTGQVVVLDRTVVIGRRPRSTRVTGTDLPHLIAVDSPEQDISRSHLEVRVEGDSILATDLHTTNGTTLRRAGADPVRLHPGERNVVVPGDVLDLGDGITVTVEDIA